MAQLVVDDLGTLVPELRTYLNSVGAIRRGRRR